MAVMIRRPVLTLLTVTVLLSLSATAPALAAETERESMEASIDAILDNAFPDVARTYAERGARFLAVISNEAWYEDGVEMDYMVAFSRLLAVATGRTIVRATSPARTPFVSKAIGFPTSS